MARTKQILSREQQRAIVLNSPHFVSGDEFNRNVIAPLLGLTYEGTANLLSAMAHDGFLSQRKLKQGYIAYSKPASKFARMKIRQNSNEALGIEAAL